MRLELGARREEREEPECMGQRRREEQGSTNPDHTTI